MNELRKAGPRRPAAVLGALAALVVALLASIAITSRPDADAARVAAGPDSKLAACSGASKPAAAVTPRQLRASVRCLINRKRARRDVDAVHRHPSLRKAAQRHAKTMVAAGCLAHQCGEERDLEERLRRAGYFDGAKSWSFAENTGCATSAKAMVANWFKSREHRLNLVERSFADIGVGVVGEPVRDVCGGEFATFTVVLGWRKPA